MIALHNVSKRYLTDHGPHQVLHNINTTIGPGEKVGIMGKNGSGKSTLIRLLGGGELPSSGRIHRGMNVSWPLAFGGAFQGSLSGLDNLRFICRIYNVPFESKLDFVQDFAELGEFFREPVKTYSSGMRARLAFAISMAIEFDCFLIDEVITVGDARFHKKCQSELVDKRADRALVIVSHEVSRIRKHCDRAVVLHNGALHEFADMEEAIGFYQSH
jgi:capsular polysaccharide transport system ATP-binding protein